MRNVSTEVVEEIQTHILYSITFFFSEYCVVYEIMKNMFDPEVPKMTPQYGAYELHAG
jgi:hypothetical protein